MWDSTSMPPASTPRYRWLERREIPYSAANPQGQPSESAPSPYTTQEADLRREVLASLEPLIWELNLSLSRARLGDAWVEEVVWKKDKNTV